MKQIPILHKNADKLKKCKQETNTYSEETTLHRLSSHYTNMVNNTIIHTVLSVQNRHTKLLTTTITDQELLLSNDNVHNTSY